MKPLTGFVLLTVMGILVNAYAYNVENLHILTISNGHYIHSREKNAAIDFSGAHVSSATVTKLFSDRFALKTVTALRSDPSHIISRSDVFSVLEKAKQRIGKASGKDYLVVYYVGHGYGEGLGWNYYLQPGNIGMPDQLNEFDIEAVAEQLVYVGFFVEMLEEFGIPYVLFIDACYQGDAQDFNTPVLTETAIQNLTDIAAVFKYLNQFRNPNPIVFSATPGKTVGTVKHPTMPDLNYNIGPIARRMVLYFEKRVPAGGYSIKRFVEGLKENDLDPLTDPVVSYHEMESDYVILAKTPQVSKEVSKEELFGTSGKADFTVLRGSIKGKRTGASYTGEDSEPHEKPYMVKFATLSIGGEKGEYISEGKGHLFTSGIEQFSLSTLTANEIVLEISDGDENWSFTIAMPAGEKFEAKTYEKVERYPFQEPSVAGMEFSGAGRGCSEITGKFIIESISYNGELPSSISVTFFQQCDDDPAKLKGHMLAEFEAK